MGKPKANNIFYNALSKSRFVQGLQCKKLLYHSVHDRELFPKVDSSQQAVFDQGHEVGLRAQVQYPNGILISATYREPEKAVEDTDLAIKGGALSLFEAAFSFDGVLVRIDILTRKSKNAPWDLIEVKSTTGLKDVHLPDIAVQTWVARSSGLDVRRQYLMHLNRECEYPDLSDLFMKEEVTDQVSDLIPNVPKQVKEMKLVLEEEKAPKIDIGPHCNEPYECPLKSICWKNVPTPSVFDVPGLSQKKKWVLYNDGKKDLKKIPVSTLNSTQKRMIEISLGKKPFIDAKKIKEELNDWKFPLTFFDFETINPAIPRFDGTSPYTHTAFQFSCHVTKKKGAKTEHFEFLHDDASDPRPKLIKSLLELIPKKGAVIAFNSGFEKNVLFKLAESSPKHSTELKGIADRLVDLLPIFRKHVYHKDFLGSFSIKAVAPALLGKELSYDGMEVGDGTEAQVAFESLISGQLAKKEKAALREVMLAYCEKDTWAMVKLYEWLAELYIESKCHEET